jgi:hypothetical protein
MSTSSNAVYTTLPPETAVNKNSLKYTQLLPENDDSARARPRPPPPTDDYVADDPNARRSSAQACVDRRGRRSR